jgi:hypothetical protein
VADTKDAAEPKVPSGLLFPTPVRGGIDCRQLPYEDAAIDCVVLDPPYMEGLLRETQDHLAGSGTHGSFRTAYSHGKAVEGASPKWHDAVTDLYARAGREAYRS